jgi:flagellar basal-body rod protein FlgB
MPQLNTPLLTLSERALDVATARQTTIAGNMANVDTPGYHTRDVDFGAELQRLLSDPGNGTSMQAAGRVVPGLIARPDGNNVSMERESLLSAQTQLQFDTAIQLVRAEFKRLQMAIEAQ